MRQAELLGLTWRSIDFRRGTLSISQQLQRQRARASGSDVAAKQWSLEPTKTKAGNRTLSMSTAVAGVLRNLQQQREEERANAGEAWCDTFVEDGDLLFTTSEGQPLYGSQIYKFLKSCLKQLGLPDITFHDLRHTAATLLLHEGYSSGSVAEIFGHSNKGVTDSIYAHGLVAVKVEALDRISRMLAYSGELPREEGTSTRNLGQNDRESSRDSHSDSQLPNDRKLQRRCKCARAHSNAGAEDGTRTHKTLRSAVFKPFARHCPIMLLAALTHQNAEYDLIKRARTGTH